MLPNEFDLKKEPDPILYKKLENYDFACGMDTYEIERVMTAIMEDENGIGISANQVGFDRRVVVIHPKGQIPFALFNPVIIDRQGTCLEDEGCLSFPGLFMKIERAETVTVKYLDRDSKECTIILSGIDSKCIQHEIDHLDGICFTSRVSKMKLDLARKRQRKLLNGRT